MTTNFPKVDFFQRVGQTNNGRVVYQIKDGNEIKSVSVPKENQDRFEKLNQEMQDKTQESYSKNFSKSKAKRIKTFLALNTIIGAGLGWLISKNKSCLTKSFSIITGALVGAGATVLHYANKLIEDIKSPAKKMKKLDVKEFKD